MIKNKSDKTIKKINKTNQKSANDDHTKDRIDPIPDLFLQRITISISIRSDPHSKYQRHSTIQCYK